MPSSLAQKLSPADLKTYVALLEQAQFYPHRVFEEVKTFQEKHPDLPEAANLLIYLYIQKKELVKAEKLTQENYEKFPDYLFARINYADQCLRKKQWDQIPKIFPSFHLRELYPEKKLFHFSEFRGFMVTMGLYYLALKNRAAAKEYLDHARLADPDHSSVKLLEKKLRANFIMRFWDDLRKNLPQRSQR
ncbi:MAG TPA: hypothetical protein VLF61_01490 [Rhabdochlamydiaceae bacterium]|nr:hypothetical protein [Rhabdochlamydiaceae bacterium]